MKQYPHDKEINSQNMQKEIAKQKEQIAEKEKEIQAKHEQLRRTESEYAEKLAALGREYEREQAKKNELEANLREVK